MGTEASILLSPVRLKLRAKAVLSWTKAVKAFCAAVDRSGCLISGDYKLG
jgi:hypothetical protein